MAEVIRVVQSIPLVIPDITLDKRALEEIAAVIENESIENILNQRQADGSALKANPPGYRKAKESAGFGGKSLIRKDHSLVRDRKGVSREGGAKGSARSTFQSNVNVLRGSVSVELSPGKAKERGEAVQERGYEGWFGINERVVKLIELVVIRFIKRAVAKAK